jgi:hypothetical protein
MNEKDWHDSNFKTALQSWFRELAKKTAGKFFPIIIFLNMSGQLQNHPYVVRTANQHSATYFHFYKLADLHYCFNDTILANKIYFSMETSRCKLI